MARTALYRHFDAEGRLLYVGITCNLGERDNHHSAVSAWHGQVRRTETEWCLTREHARDLEAVAIKHEKPLHNMAQPQIVKPVARTPTANNRDPILPEIEGFLAATGISESYFGKASCGNSELVARLRDGGGVTFKTAEKIRRYMRKATSESAA